MKALEYMEKQFAVIEKEYHDAVYRLGTDREELKRIEKEYSILKNRVKNGEEAVATLTKNWEELRDIINELTERA